MSAALRKFAQGTVTAISKPKPGNTFARQERNVGDLPVKPNKHIEAWATYREHLEDTFTFDAKTLAILSVTLVAFPTFLYNVMTKEFNKADDKAGRARKELM